MKRIMIYYHSGAGSTKMIAEILKEKLSALFDVGLKRVGRNYPYEEMKNYDFFVFGFPVYGFDVSQSMKEFIQGIPAFNGKKSCFIYCTLGIVSGNALANMSQMLHRKNIVTVGWEKIYSPGSDASLMFPATWKWTRSFKKKTPEKLNRIIQLIEKDNIQDAVEKMPQYKPCWGFIEKLILKFILRQEKKMIISMRIGEERCINCGRCVSVCERGCITQGNAHPVIHTENCEFCMGCIHQCPKNAITFMKKYFGQPKLGDRFFKEEKKKMLERMQNKNRQA